MVSTVVRGQTSQAPETYRIPLILDLASIGLHVFAVIDDILIQILVVVN